MAYYQVFTEKEKLKQNKDLVELHKRCIKTYLVTKSCRVKIRNKFFKLYDMYINEKNIVSYFYTPISILVQALVLNQLENVSTYILKSNGKSKKSNLVLPKDSLHVDPTRVDTVSAGIFNFPTATYGEETSSTTLTVTSATSVKDKNKSRTFLIDCIILEPVKE